MADDFKANIRTNGTVAVGAAATGAIGTRRDVDWFAVELADGRTYVIDLEGDDTGGGTLGNTMLRGLFDSAGERIADTRSKNGGEGDNARLTFTASESGTYYIAASGQGRDTGTYTVRVTEFDSDSEAAGARDLGDITEQSRPSALQDSLDGGSDRADYFRFTLSEAKKVKLNLRKQDANADLYLEDGNGTVLHASTRNGTRNEGIEETLQAGTYYVRVAAQEAGGNSYALNHRVADPEPEAPPEDERPEPDTPGAPQERSVRSVQTSVSEPDGEDFAADTSTKGGVAVGGSATGAIVPIRGQWDHDRDWFAVTLEKGKTYRIDADGYWEGKGTLGAPRLHGVHDADGNLIEGTADSYDSFARLYFAPDETATHYVAVGAFRGNIGRTYTLSVTEMPVDPTDDFAAGTDTDGKVKVGGSAAGEIESAGDRDWFAVTLEKSHTYQFDLTGKNTCGPVDCDMLDPAIRGIYDSGGNRLPGTMDNDGGPTWHSQVTFTPGADGTYYVSASGAEYYTVPADRGGVHNTGTYTLSVEEVVDAM